MPPAENGPTCRTPPGASVQSMSSESVHEALSLEAPISMEDDRSLGMVGELGILCGMELFPFELGRLEDSWAETVLNQLETLIVDQKILKEPRFQAEASEKDAVSLGFTFW